MQNSWYVLVTNYWTAKSIYYCADDPHAQSFFFCPINILKFSIMNLTDSRTQVERFVLAAPASGRAKP